MSSRVSSRGPAGLCTDRFQNYVVTVDGVECARGNANGQLDYLRIPCNKRGRTVRLQLLGNDYLNLLYVGVEGTKAPITRVEMTDAKMSSVFSPVYAAANCLTDSGASDTTMCHTAGVDNGPWWQATTADGALYDISSVIVRNRAACCWERLQEYVVTVDGAECARGDANGKQGYLEIACNKRGRTVRLQLLMQGNNYLNLQYIGVKGTKAP